MILDKPKIESRNKPGFFVLFMNLKNELMLLPSVKSLHHNLNTLLIVLVGAALLSSQDVCGDEFAALVPLATHYLQQQTVGLPGTVQIQVAPPDSRLHLTPCPQPEFFLPPSSKLWGRSMVGVRCSAPKPWTIYLDIDITVEGHYIISTRPLTRGQPVDPTTLTTATGELTRLPPDILTDPAQARGKIMTTSLSAGAPLRASQLHDRNVIDAGQVVDVVSEGHGFEISNQGRAINAASDGQSVQVRMPNGQVITGTARADGQVLTH